MICTARTEEELREYEVPWIDNIDDLTVFIRDLKEREHNYGTAVYAMSIAAVAAFYYIAKGQGVTGFQASCADLDILRRLRHLDSPFALIKADDMLYPQCDIASNVQEILEKWKPWAKEQAKAFLTEPKDHVSENVIAHWKRLAYE